MRDSGSTVLISAGWGVASFLGAALLWPAYQEMALVGAVMGLSTGLAFLRARLINEWKYIPVLAALWAVGIELPVIVAGPRPELVAEVFGFGIVGTATGLVLRISGRDVPWRSLMFAGAACAIAPIAAFVVGIPVFAATALLTKDPPAVLINALFGVGGCVAGALAGLVLLTQFSRSDSAERVGVRPDNLTNKHLTPQGAVVYEAFISYRHSRVGERWANWLHSQRESWRTPVVLSRSRGTRKRLLPVFMDQAELIASPDLPTEIRRALEASRFLIVVCSPRTPHSRWISEEVEHFIRLGRRKEILFLLIEGELRDALPLSYAAPEVPSEDAATTLVEPLAADVRPTDTKTSRKKRRLAILKLVAPILGVGLDDLRRRDEQRRRRNGILTAVAACAAIATVGVLVSNRIASDRLTEAKGLAQRAADVVENKPIRGLIMAAHALKQNLVAGREADTAIVHTLLKAMSRNSGTPLNGHNSAVRALAFARDEAWLVSADFGGRLGFWNLKSSPPRVIWKETGRPRILTLDSSEDGRWLVAGADGLITMCDVSISERVECSPLARPEGQIWSAAFSPDGTWLATGGTDKQVRLWRKAGNGTFEYFGELPVALPVVKLSWSPMGEWLAASTAFTDLPKERQDYNSVVRFAIAIPGKGPRFLHQ